MIWQQLIRIVQRVNTRQERPLLKLSIPLVVLAGLGLFVWGQSESKGPPLVFVPSGVDSTALRIVGFTDEERSFIRGKALFTRFCAVCHGEAGDGKGPNSWLILEMIGKTPKDFTDPEFWKWIYDAEIEQAIRFGGGSIKDSVLMPAFEDILLNRDVLDLISYLKTFQPDKGEI